MIDGMAWGGVIAVVAAAPVRAAVVQVNEVRVSPTKEGVEI
ncbi:MAG: hypothetical protein ACFB2W_08970 [Leptolyngbyaceae cyanobacterium]